MYIFCRLALKLDLLNVSGVNWIGLYTKYLTERAQRKAFLETRRSLEMRFKTQKENERQERCCPCPFIQILSRFYHGFIQILSRFYPDFYPDIIQILSRFYPDIIQILSRFYPDFTQILSRFYPNFNLDRIRMRSR